MKINVVPTVIIVLAALLLGYLFYTISSAEEQMLYALGVSGFVTTTVTMLGGFGISFGDSHYTVNTFALSLFFLLVFVVEHVCFAIWGTSMPALVITTGLTLVVYLLAFYGVTKAKM